MQEKSVGKDDHAHDNKDADKAYQAPREADQTESNEHHAQDKDFADEATRKLV